MTLGAYLLKKFGVGDSVRLRTWLVLWAMFLELEGREPTVDDFETEFGMSKSTYYRRLAQWQEAFPGHRTPTVLVLQWQAASAAKRFTPARLGRVDLGHGFA